MWTKKVTTKTSGEQAERMALEFLQKQGLKLVCQNFRTKGRGGGEIDLIMRQSDGTIVFVEVRKRSSEAYGGAGASIDYKKQKRIIFAARQYLLNLPSAPPCRFDVILVKDRLQWIEGAFEAIA